MSTKVEVKEIANTKSEKYSLRSRESIRPRRPRKLLEDEVSEARNFRKNDKNKERPPPLSKYRRKTANARERSRMREINIAFETLRKVVPSHTPQLHFMRERVNEKLTKITTLRLAMRYIARLTEMLTKKKQNCNIKDCIDSFVNYPTNFIEKQPEDTCSFAALNSTISGDYFSQETGSDGESFHSGVTVRSNSLTEDSIEKFLPLGFPNKDLFSSTELS